MRHTYPSFRCVLLTTILAGLFSVTIFTTSFTRPLSRSITTGILQSSPQRGGFTADMSGTCQGAPTDCQPPFLHPAALGLLIPGRPSLERTTCGGEALALFNPLSDVLFRWTSPSSPRQGHRWPHVETKLVSNTAALSDYIFSTPQAPQWAFSGAWLERDGVVLLVDLPTQSLFHVSLREAMLRQVRAFDSSSDKPYLPRSVARQSGGGFLLQTVDSQFVWIDNHYRRTKKLSLNGYGNPAQGLINGIWNWCQSGTKVVALADIQRGDSWFSGLVRIDPAVKTQFELIQPMALESQNRQYARLGLQLLACTTRSAYALLIDPQPGVYKLVRQIRRLRDFPDGFNTPPSFERDFPPTESIEQIYQRFEQAPTPVQLMSDSNSLYVLLRSPRKGEPGPVWHVAKISLLTETVSQPVELRTSASDLLLFPGDSSWALVEKGPVKGYHRQQVERITRIPSPFQHGARGLPHSLALGSDHLHAK